jgi:hypothetical protein
MSDMVSKVITKPATIQVYNDIMGGTDQSGMMFIVTDHIGGVTVSELRPPTGLLFIPRVNESMQSLRDDDTGWGKLLTCPPELSGNPTSRDIWKRVGGMDKEMIISRISIFDTSVDIYHALNVMTWGLWLYFPSEGRSAVDFVALKNPSPRQDMNFQIQGSSGKHTNQYTTEVTRYDVIYVPR